MIDVVINIPDKLLGKVRISELYGSYATGGKLLNYYVDIEFSEINRSKKLKAPDKPSLKRKVDLTLIDWAKEYEQHLDKIEKQLVEEDLEIKNRKINDNIRALGEIFSNILYRPRKLDWSYLQNSKPFSFTPEDYAPKNVNIYEFIAFRPDGKPSYYDEVAPPEKPDIGNVSKRYTLSEKLFNNTSIQKEYDSKLSRWEREKTICEEQNLTRKQIFNTISNAFEGQKSKHERECAGRSRNLEILKKRFLNNDKEAIEEYFNKILYASEMPPSAPMTWNMEYYSDDSELLIQIDLISPSEISPIRSYEFDAKDSNVKTNKMSDAARNKIYDEVVYQTCIIVIYDLFEADTTNILKSVILNGVITSRDEKSGKLKQNTIVSLMAYKISFMEFDFEKLTPEEIFIRLNGETENRPHSLVPVKPIATLQNISTKEEAEPQSDFDLNSIEWESFERLIRKVLEQEFTVFGGSVEITSINPGEHITAVINDPDPIRGGKMIIKAAQTKEEISALSVSELHQDMIYENAIKAIYMTTSSFSDECYSSTKGKPVILICCKELKKILEKHGYGHGIIIN